MPGKDKNYAVEGMHVKCSMGETMCTLNTIGHGVTYQGKSVLNANDHIPVVNITTFGVCTCTGVPCVPVTPLAWKFCNEEHMIDGAAALTTDSLCNCVLGGVISIVDNSVSMGGIGTQGIKSKISTEIVDKDGKESDTIDYENGSDTSIKNINEFIEGNKSFDDVLDDYVKIYANNVNSNQMWTWDDSMPGGENLTARQRKNIKQQAIDRGLLPKITITKVKGMRYGFADFESAGVVKETKYLPEEMWKMTDNEQFKWLDEQIGGNVEGYTWHHTEIPGKMQLVPTGIHNITTHNGGRSAGMWADAPR